MVGWPSDTPKGTLIPQKSAQISKTSTPGFPEPLRLVKREHSPVTATNPTRSEGLVCGHWSSMTLQMAARCVLNGCSTPAGRGEVTRTAHPSPAVGAAEGHGVRGRVGGLTVRCRRTGRPASACEVSLVCRQPGLIDARGRRHPTPMAPSTRQAPRRPQKLRSVHNPEAGWTLSPGTPARKRPSRCLLVDPHPA